MFIEEPSKAGSFFSPRQILREWAPVLLLVGLFVLSHRGLLEFTPISPLNESHEGIIDGQLFVPNQKPQALIFGLAIFFLVSRFPRLRSSLAEKPASLTGAFLLVFGLVIGIWSHYTATAALLILSLSMMLLGTAGVLGGRPAIRAMRLPALFPLLAFPIPGVLLNSLVYELQLLTAAMNGAILSLAGIGNLVSGDTIYTSVATFQVIEGCSGLRAMETMVMTAIVYQELVPHSRLYSWILVTTAPVLGVLVNQLRVLAIVLNPFAEGSSDHTLQGIVMIVVGTLMLAGFAALLARWLPPSGPGHGAIGKIAVPKPVWPIFRLGIVILVLLISVAATQGNRWELERPDHRNPTSLPGSFESWKAESKRIDREFLGSTHYTQAASRVYRRGEEEVSLLLAVDSRKRPLLSGISPKNSSLGQGWEVVSEDSHSIANLPGIQVATSVQRKQGRYAYVMFWQQGVDPFGTEVFRNAFAVDRSPWQRPYDATLIRLSTPMVEYSPGQESEAYERLQPFVELVRQHFPLPDTSSWN